MAKKFGEDHVVKMLGRGAKEAAQALQALPDSIRVVEEPGLASKETLPTYEQKLGAEVERIQIHGHAQQIVANEKSEYDKWLDQQVARAESVQEADQSQGMER